MGLLSIIVLAIAFITAALALLGSFDLMINARTEKILEYLIEP
jgi:hypothetical protein